MTTKNHHLAFFALATIVNMKNLPFEIIVNILGHLSVGSLQDVRLVCREFETLCNKLLFQKVFLSTHEKDMEVFQLLQDRFPRYVHTLILSIRQDDESEYSDIRHAMKMVRLFRSALDVMSIRTVIIKGSKTWRIESQNFRMTRSQQKIRCRLPSPLITIDGQLMLWDSAGQVVYPLSQLVHNSQSDMDLLLCILQILSSKRMGTIH